MGDNLRTRLFDLLIPAGCAAAAAGLAPAGWALAAGGAAGLLAAALRFAAVTQAKSAQTAPREIERDRSDLALLSDIPIPVLLIAGDGSVRFANVEAGRLLSRAVEGDHISSVFRAPSLVSAVEEAISGGREDSFDFRVRRPRERILTATVRALPDRGPDQPRVMLSLRDNTGSTRIEAARSDFVANASHELRTPLAAISGIVETLRGAARDDPEAQERFLEMIAKQTGRMTRLVNDLLSLSRIELEENVAPTEVQDLRAILGEVAATMGALAKDKGVALREEIPASLPPVHGSRDELAQVFVNLIGNAIRYGGGTVRVEAETVEGTVRVSVSDDGPGIAAHHIPRLTERFYRVDPGDSRARGGTGLGLAIVKHILNRHRGRLDIVSTEGEGARFTVILPVAA